MKIVPLQSEVHNRDYFSCGVEELDAYLKKYALQDTKRNLSKVFFMEGRISGEIIGYYSLSSFSFSKSEITPGISKKLPRYPIPAILLGRLAMGIDHQGKRFGAKLLMDALLRVQKVSESFGIYAVVVDAKDEKASAFYQRFGFIPFEEKTKRLFVPLEVIKKLSSPLLHEEMALGLK